MEHSDCYYLGEIRKLHGVEGKVAVYLDTDDPSRYKGMDSVLVESDGMLVPYFIQQVELKNGNEAIIKFEDLSRDEAEQLLGLSLYLPLSLLPALTGNKFYYHEVPGFEVVDKTHGLVGTVQQVLDFPRQAVLQVINGDKEILIPVADDIILLVDRDRKTIEVDLPEGLLDVYA